MTDTPTALVTGASSGIGEALARDLARRGYSVALLGRRTERLEAIRKSLPNPDQHLALTADVTQDADLANAIEEMGKHWSGLDVVMANAGFGVVGKVERLVVEDYKRQFETNIFGVIRTVKASLALLRARKGAVGIIGSVNGYVALAGNSPYAMSKFAVRALADALRLELKSDGVSVTHIAPGFVQSEIRSVDNKGRHRTQVNDPIPMWIQMPADKAARQIARAVICRRSERVVTLHGKLAVFLARHFPRFLQLLLGSFGMNARREPRPSQKS